MQLLLLGICPQSSICSFLSPHLCYVFLQDCFLTDTKHELALSLKPDPTTHTPEKELKGVTFSEVAIILDAECEGDEPDDNYVFFHQ